MFDWQGFFSHFCSHRMDVVGCGAISRGDDTMDLITRKVNSSTIIDGETRCNRSVTQQPMVRRTTLGFTIIVGTATAA